MDIYNLVSFAGIFILLGFAWLLSSDRKNMNFRVIGWGVGLQILIALFIFVVPAGAEVFRFVNDVVVNVLDSASAGAELVFGRLALPPGQTNEAGEESLGFFLAFQAFPTIIFFSALIAILYYFGVMSFVIRGFAFVFTKLKSCEVYYVLEGQGLMHIDGEDFEVGPECAVYIHPDSIQYIENTGNSNLKFLCIVDPAWRKEDEEVLDH